MPRWTSQHTLFAAISWPADTYTRYHTIHCVVYSDMQLACYSLFPRTKRDRGYCKSRSQSPFFFRDYYAIFNSRPWFFCCSTEYYERLVVCCWDVLHINKDSLTSWEKYLPPQSESPLDVWCQQRVPDAHGSPCQRLCASSADPVVERERKVKQWPLFLLREGATNSIFITSGGTRDPPCTN